MNSTNPVSPADRARDMRSPKESVVREMVSLGFSSLTYTETVE